MRVRIWAVAGALVCLGGCAGTPRPLPPVPRPVAGYWYDYFRDRRAALDDPGLLVGAAKVKLTPTRRGVRIAGHGHYLKHSVGVLDDLWGRVLYLDTGEQAVALVSLDFIGWMHPRVERIRARVSRTHPGSILVASTHNHDGPDTEGLWGNAVMGLVPLRSGVDPAYLDWVERRVAAAIERAVASARPARLRVGHFQAPAGWVVNMREPDDVPLTGTVLRAEGLDGRTIATLVEFGNHAEALQDKNRWVSSDWPGELCRQVDRALGGVSLFVSGPAGGMLEPADEPDDPAGQRIAFMRRLGGVLAEGVIRLSLGGMTELPHPRLRLQRVMFDLPIDPGSTVALVIRLGLLEPRPIRDGALRTEAALVDLGGLQLVTVPGEITPEVGRAIRAKLPGPYSILVTLGLDHLAYMVSDRQRALPQFQYERDMSLGPETTDRMLAAIDELVARMKAERGRTARAPTPSPAPAHP